jgi:hypothetical protein
MSKWFMKLEMYAIVAADTEEHARDAFALEFGVRPGEYDVVTRIDDDEVADLVWESAP